MIVYDVRVLASALQGMLNRSSSAVMQANFSVSGEGQQQVC